MVWSLSVEWDLHGRISQVYSLLHVSDEIGVAEPCGTSHSGIKAGASISRAINASHAHVSADSSFFSPSLHVY
jgi:hypothetical protein